jgi:hypothetical protein
MKFQWRNDEKVNVRQEGTAFDESLGHMPHTVIFVIPYLLP